MAITLLPLGDLLLQPLESRFPVHPAVNNVAGIIVLGGGADADLSNRTGILQLNEAGDRYTAAVTLSRRFPDAQVLFAGGSADLTGPKISEGPVALRIFTDLGVDPARIHIEGTSRTTAENATLLRKKWAGEGQGAWLLVTSAFHMPRAMGTFCQAGWTHLVAWPVDHRAGDFAVGLDWNLTGHLSELDTGIKEWLGLAAYYATGRSSSLFPASCEASSKAPYARGDPSSFSK